MFFIKQNTQTGMQKFPEYKHSTTFYIIDYRRNNRLSLGNKLIDQFSIIIDHRNNATPNLRYFVTSLPNWKYLLEHVESRVFISSIFLKNEYKLVHSTGGVISSEHVF